MGLITFINVVLGVALGGLLYTVFPTHYFRWFPSIPLFYWVMGMLMSFVLDQIKQRHGDLIVTAYMVARLCKFVIAFCFLYLYATQIGEHVRSFGLTLMLFYFIYLVLETYMLYLFEKRRIKHKNQHVE